MTELEERLLTRTLDRIERHLAGIADASRINAMFFASDPELVLPSPAVSIMAVTTEAGTKLGPDHYFRSLDPIGPDGEIIFTAVHPELLVHPWKVERVEWIGLDRAPGPAAPVGLADGFRIRLERTGSKGDVSGPLALWVSSFAGFPLPLHRIRASHDGRNLSTRGAQSSPDPVRRGPVGGGDVLRHHLAAIHRDLLFVELPRGMATEERLDLDFRFEEPAAVGGDIEVVANAVPVWNSMPSRYPDPTRVAQLTSESDHRLIHPLEAPSLGPRWVAWKVGSVHGATDRTGSVSPSSPANGSPSGPGYHLAYAPAGEEDAFRDTGDARAPVLSVVLDPGMRRALDEGGDRVRIEFAATTGAEANAVPRGTAFELVDSSGLPVIHRTTGELSVGSWGGSNGLLPWMEDTGACSSASMLRPQGQVRSVEDVCGILRGRFGDELSLVDEWDLVRARPGATGEPLLVRVRFSRPDRTPCERRAILSACRSFLGWYLSGQAHGGFQLVDEDA